MSIPALEIVAERELHLADGRPFKVQWFKPIPYVNDDWLCVYEFSHPDGFKYRHSSAGVDSMQALFLAMQSAAVNLYEQEAAIYWLTSNDDIGLPLPSSRENLRKGKITESYLKIDLGPDDELASRDE